MCWYPVQRHRLPDSASRTAASSGSGVSARNATVDGGQFRPQAEINGKPGADDQKVEAHIAQRRTDHDLVALHFDGCPGQPA